MGFKAALSIPFASFVYKNVENARRNALDRQSQVLTMLVAQAKNTQFGHEHHFDKITNYADFKRQIPLRTYEELKPWVERLMRGEANVLWPGKPLYLTKTSGTTSGMKYIPISAQSISNHIDSARNALLLYIHETGKNDFVDRNMLFLSGSPELKELGGVKTGRLSGIVNHHIPAYLRANQVPSYATNIIEDWEQKIEAIIDETSGIRLSLISGIPAWVQMFFNRLEKRKGKPVREIFPDLSLYVYGGVNFEPYRAGIEVSIGRKIDTIETYPASEGFIAYQDTRTEQGLMLVVDSGIFYEFVRIEDMGTPEPERLTLSEVTLHQNYAIILNSNAGLWGYILGDTIRFVSLEPYRIVVTGRIKHYISAFGEHVIGEEVDLSLRDAALQQQAVIREFTVAPRVIAERQGELPYHEWFIEFENLPQDLTRFAHDIDHSLQERNSYYKDLIQGKVLQPLKIRVLEEDSFINLMRAEGKLGGQNKVPRLSNDRKLAEKLLTYIRQ